MRFLRRDGGCLGCRGCDREFFSRLGYIESAGVRLLAVLEFVVAFITAAFPGFISIGVLRSRTLRALRTLRT
jgi:hypothetical protein